MAKFKLSDIETEEVSLVPKGANNRKFFLVKRAEGDVIMSAEQLVARLMKSEDDSVEKVCEGISPELKETIKVTKKLLEVIKENVSDADQEKILELLINKGESDMPDKKEKEMEEKKKLDQEKMTEEEMLAEKEKIEEEKKKKSVSKEEEPAKENVEKADVIMKENVELRKELETFRKKFEDSESARITKEFIEEASQFKNLAISPAEFGPVLKAVKESTPEGYDKLMTVLKSADEALKENELFKSVGSDVRIAAGSAWDKIEKLASGLVEKSEGLSKEGAIDRILKTPEGKNLYNQYEREMGGAA